MAAENIGKLVVRIEANLKNFEGNMNKATKRVDGFGSTVKKIGGLIAGAFAVKAIVNLGKTMITAASDAEEMQSKFNTVFGKMSKSTEDWAKDFRDAVGGSKIEIKSMLADSADLLAGFGATEEQAFGLSTKIQSLGTDIASFSNIQGGAEEAVTKLRKGLMGETENLKSLGIVINQKMLQDELMAKGDERKLKDLSELEKMELRYTIAVRQSTNAIGDAEKTSGGFANQMRDLEGQVKDVAAGLGISLLPTATKVVTFMVDSLPAIKRFIEEGFAKLGEVIGWIVEKADILIPVLAGVVAGIVAFKIISTIVKLMKAWKTVTVGMATVQAALNAVMASNPAVAIAIAIAALTTAIVFFVSKTKRAVNELKNELIKGFEEERDAAIKAIDEQYNSRIDYLNDTLRYRKIAHDKRLSLIQDEYNKEIIALDKRESALKENLQERKSLLESEYRNNIERIRDEFGVFEEKTKSRTDLAKEQYDNEVKAATEAHNEKISLIDKEFAASLILLDEETRENVKAIEDRINAIDKQTQEEEKIAKVQRNKEKIRELESRIASEEDLEKKQKLKKQLNDFHEELNRKRLLNERESEKQILKNAINMVKANAEEKKKSLEEELNDKKIKLEESLEEENVILARKKDAAIVIIQEEREAKETAENAKYLASKKALDDEALAIDKYKEDYKIKLDEQLKLKQDLEDDKWTATETRIANELDGVQKLMDKETELANKRAEEKIAQAGEEAKETLKAKRDVSAVSITGGLAEKAMAQAKKINGLGGAQGFAKGTNFVPFDMPAFIHKGEAVVPADNNPNNPNANDPIGGNINYDGMFNGAIFNVRSDNDIKLIAREIYNLQSQRRRGSGVVPA